MTLSAYAGRALATSLADPGAARELVAAINTAVAATAATTIAALGTSANVTAIGSTTNITSVPGSFADAAAVQSYLAGANAVPLIESRLDVIEGKTDAQSTAITLVAGKVDAVISALKVAGLMAT